MSKDYSKYDNDELILMYKNQNEQQTDMSSEAESYDDGGYNVYLQEYSQGCFITSAVCRTFGKPDDCPELTAFRSFRDSFMKKDETMSKDVERYYKIAPSICAAIDSKGKAYAQKEYYSIWDEYLSKAFDAINTNEYQMAYDIYKTMVLNLEDKYLN